MRLETKQEFSAYRAWREALARVLRGERVDPASNAYGREKLTRRVVALQRSMADERIKLVCRKKGSEARGKI
jgi:hypothetical protein